MEKAAYLLSKLGIISILLVAWYFGIKAWNAGFMQGHWNEGTYWAVLAFGLMYMMKSQDD